MNDQIITISDRGQITIPSKIRAQIGVKNFVCVVEDSKIVLTPLQTREDFLKELDSAENDWEINGGKSLNQVKKQYKL